jgi:hypothetical protein
MPLPPALPRAPAAPHPPPAPLPAIRQRGADLGERLFNALAAAAVEATVVAAVGSDHPTLPLALVERAFGAVEAGADVVLGPAEDGGYYLIALAARAVSPRLFAGVPWSTGQVLAATLERCRELGLRAELLPPASDVDTPRDLALLARRLASPPPALAATPPLSVTPPLIPIPALAAAPPLTATHPLPPDLAADDLSCPRTRALLESWGLLPAAPPGPPAPPGPAAAPGPRGPAALPAP